MNCPNCAAPHEEAVLECAGCGIVFDKWAKRQAEREQGAAPEGLPVSDARPVGPVLAVIAVAAAAAAGYWLLVPASGGALLPGAKQDEQNQFSIAGPEGWDAGEAAAPVAASYAGPAAAGRWRQALRLRVTPGAPIRISEGVADRLLSRFMAGLPIALEERKVVSNRVLEVDGLPAFKAVVSGSKRVREEVSPAVWAERAPRHGRSRETAAPEKVLVKEAQFAEREYDLTVTTVLVSGRGRAYELDLSCEIDHRDACAAVFEKALASFRVLDRPRRWDLLTAR